MLNQVFLSYRQESIDHAKAVHRLAELLRQANIPVALDRFHLEEHPGGPDDGWPSWCEDNANNSVCVLIIASEGWFAAYDKTETAEPSGLGAATEADLFRQALWDDRGHNERVRLTFLHEVAMNRVPVRLRAWHSFRPFESDAALDELLRWLATRLEIQDIQLPAARWPAPIEYQPDLADRLKYEWQAIVDLLAGRSRKRILLFQGASGLGKSLLVHHAEIYAKKLGIPAARVDFKGGELNVAGVLGQFYLDLDNHLPNFSRQGGDKTHLLRKDLRAHRQPVLAIFDSYEYAAENKLVADWLCQQFLNEAETAFGLAVIVAGQMVPDPMNASWRDLARHQQLEPIMELEHWEPWFVRRYPTFRDKGLHLPSVLMAVLIIARGNPAVIATSCEAIAKS